MLIVIWVYSSPGMRGSTPLDVAAASCIDNNELALALQEQDLEMVYPVLSLTNRTSPKSFFIHHTLPTSLYVVKYLAGSGLLSCPSLICFNTSSWLGIKQDVDLIDVHGFNVYPCELQSCPRLIVLDFPLGRQVVGRTSIKPDYA